MDPIDIVLVEPLGDDFSPSLFTKGNSLEPVSLEWLAAYVQANAPQGRYDITVVQQRGESDQQLVDAICDLHPAVVGLSMRTHYYGRCKEMAMQIKQRLPSTLIVVGGHHPSIAHEVGFEPQFDVAVIGEGEVTFFEVMEIWREYLCSRLGAESHLSWDEAVSQREVAGISCIRDGREYLGPRRARIGDLDSLPLPVRSEGMLRDCRQWNLVYPIPERQRCVAQVSWSRGCNGRCTFCTSPVLWEGDDDGSTVHSGPVDDFAKAIRQGRPPQTGLEQALLVQRISDAIYRSASTGTAAPVV